MQKIIIPTTKDLMREIKIPICVNQQLVEVVDSVNGGVNGRVTKIFVERDAVLEYIFVLPREYGDLDFIETREIWLGDNAKARFFYCYLGGASVEVSLTNHIGCDARLEQRLLAMGSGEQLFSCVERHRFHEFGGYGRFLAHCLVRDRAKSNYDSMILIDPGAQKVDSRLDLHSIILDKRARSVMVPSLQIEANDVKAGHGATVANIDDDTLFYMNSRGLSSDQARMLFIDGLVHDFLGSFKCDDVNSVILASATLSR